MKPYRIAVNLEWTSKCNARCAMCPREAVPNPEVMEQETFQQVLGRLSPRDVFRVVIAGYGEPTTHPRFTEFAHMLEGAPVRFDMATNGQLLDPARLKQLDGVLHTLIVSFSSIDPAVYARVHANLDHARVKENIVLAQNTLRNTCLVISLSPLAECIDTLPQTIEWLHGNGIRNLSMSPSLYDRAGSWRESDPAAANLRQLIRRYRLRSQELDFIPSLRDLYRQWRANRVKCFPRNTDLAISADGSYQYCFNDIRHSHPIGHVSNMGVREALRAREQSPLDSHLCTDCNIHRRYRAGEVIRVAYAYLAS